MNAATPFKIAMVLTSDVSNAKAGLTDVTTGMRALSSEATKAGAAAQKEAAELERLAAAAAKAASAHENLTASERRSATVAVQNKALLVLSSPVAPTPVIGQYRATETAANSLRASVAGLGASVGQQAQDMVEAAQAAQSYQSALDDIRASYNPLFAASRQYEQQLERIAEAERLGAISAREAAAARSQAAAGLLAPAARGGIAGPDPNSAYTANVAAQGFDIGVTAAMGMHPGMVGLQQGTQLAQVATQMGGGMAAVRGMAAGFMALLSPMTLATIGLTTFAAFGIQALMGLWGETKTLEDALSDLESSVGRLKDANARARGGFLDLAGEFGSTTAEAKELLEVLAEVERRTAGRSAKAAMASIYNELDGGTMAGLRSESDRFSTLQRMFGEAGWFTAGRVSETGSPLSFAVSSAMDDVFSAEKTNDINAQIAAVETLFSTVQRAAGAFEGVSTEEDAWLGKIGQALADLQRIKAQDENSAGMAQTDAMTRSLFQQVELERAALTYGQDSAEVRAVQNRHERENLSLKLEGLGVDERSLNGRRAINTMIALQAEREKAAAAARREWFLALDDGIAAIQRETNLIGASADEQARVNALAEAELQIRDRRLNALEAEEARTKAIARAEAEIALSRAQAQRELQLQVQADTFDARLAGTRNPYLRADIAGEQEYARRIADGTDAATAQAYAQQARARAIGEANRAVSDHLRSQAESIQQQQLELALVGQSAEVRARVLALAQAERDITRLGAMGADAEVIRRNASAQAEIGRELEAQADAWRNVQSAGENAIDGILDKLKDRDIKGAIGAFAEELGSAFFDLQVRNPLKNMLLGTNLGTLDDVGGFGGIWARMTGNNPIDEADLVRAAATPVQSMSVTAANVVIGGNLAGLAASMGAANLNAPILTPGGLGGSLPGPDGVQAQMWAFFAAKGLKAHQIAGIMGNGAAESGFNPLAVGDAGNAFGLFQWNDRRGSLFDFIGGQQNLGDVQKQLQFAWQELMTSENGAFQKLMASTNVREATRAFVGFERPSGYTAANPEGAMHFDRRLAAAEAAMVKFEGATVNAQAQLGQLGTGAAQLGTGLQTFGSSISGAIQQAGAQRGLGGMVVGGLLSGLGQMIGIPGFRVGGWTGPGDAADVAGLVHAGEFVFDAATTRRIGVQNLEAIRSGRMRGYREGGFVSRGAPASMAPANAERAPQSGRERVEFNLNVTGTGNEEMHQLVLRALGTAFEEYDRDALPDRVKMIVNDRWGS